MAGPFKLKKGVELKEFFKTELKMPKVMTDGKTNKLNEAKITKEKARVAALTPEELQAEKDALIKRKKAFDLKNKR